LACKSTPIKAEFRENLEPDLSLPNPEGTKPYKPYELGDWGSIPG